MHLLTAAQAACSDACKHRSPDTRRARWTFGRLYSAGVASAAPPPAGDGRAGEDGGNGDTAEMMSSSVPAESRRAARRNHGPAERASAAPSPTYGQSTGDARRTPHAHVQRRGRAAAKTRTALILP